MSSPVKCTMSGRAACMARLLPKDHRELWKLPCCVLVDAGDDTRDTAERGVLGFGWSGWGSELDVLDEEVFVDELLGDEPLGDELSGDEVLWDEVLGEELLRDKLFRDQPLGDDRVGYRRDIPDGGTGRERSKVD